MVMRVLYTPLYRYPTGITIKYLCISYYTGVRVCQVIHVCAMCAQLHTHDNCHLP
jgi:hypothetical protein